MQELTLYKYKAEIRTHLAWFQAHCPLYKTADLPTVLGTLQCEKAFCRAEMSCVWLLGVHFQ